MNKKNTALADEDKNNTTQYSEPTHTQHVYLALIQCGSKLWNDWMGATKVFNKNGTHTWQQLESININTYQILRTVNKILQSKNIQSTALLPKPTDSIDLCNLEINTWIEKDTNGENNIDFSDFYIHEAYFNNTKFDSATFRGASLSGVEFHGAQFSTKTDFCEAEFDNVDFLGAQFDWVEFLGAQFNNTSFRGAQFDLLDFRGATFDFADFRGAQLEWADFRGTEFVRADFGGAQFDTADFRGAQFGHATFQNAIFKNYANFGSGDKETLVHIWNQYKQSNSKSQSAKKTHLDIKKEKNHLLKNHLLKNHLLKNHLLKNHLLKEQWIEEQRFKKQWLKEQRVKNQLLEEQQLKKQWLEKSSSFYTMDFFCTIFCNSASFSGRTLNAPLSFYYSVFCTPPEIKNNKNSQYFDFTHTKFYHVSDAKKLCLDELNTMKSLSLEYAKTPKYLETKLAWYIETPKYDDITSLYTKKMNVCIKKIANKIQMSERKSFNVFAPLRFLRNTCIKILFLGLAYLS